MEAKKQIFSLEDNKELLLKIKEELKRDKILEPYLYFVGETNVNTEKVKKKVI